MPAYKDENGRGTWYASFRYTDWTGRVRPHKKRGFAKKRDALDYETEFKRKAKQSPDMTFASLVELYREDAENRTQDTTQKTKGSIVDTYLLPDLGRLKVSEITPATVRRWQNGLLAKTNPRTGKKYAPTYLRSINSQLSTIFNYAVKFHGLASNPCYAAGFIGKKKAPRMKFWTLEEFNKAMEAVDDWGKRVAFLILYWMGFRASECLALTPADIPPTKMVRITKNYRRVDGADAEGPTKTENSVRDTSMPDFLYDEVQRYIGALYGIRPDDRIFYFTRGTLNAALDKAAAKAGVKRIRVHDLRHSHAALLIELNYSIVMVAERLGDTVEVAENTYAHLYPDKSAAVAADLNRHQLEFGQELEAVEEAGHVPSTAALGEQI